MPRKSLPVVLSGSEIIRLEQWIRAGSTPQQVVLRAKIVVNAARGGSDQEIARQLKVQRRTAALWRRRICEQGIGRVWEIASGRGRKASCGNVRRGAFHSVMDLEKAIKDFMDAWNANPTPFVWTATVENILEKLALCRRRLEQIQPGCTKQKSRKSAKINE